MVDFVEAASPNFAPTVVNIEIGNGLLGSSGWLDSNHVAFADADTISITFSEGVNVASSDLRLLGTNGVIAATQFSYDAFTHEASWTFASAFSSGTYQLVLDDRLADSTGVRLDGEVPWSGTDAPGNGLAGGDLVFDFDVVVGDVDNNGTTEARDLALIDEAIAGGIDAITFDLNLDGLVNVQDAVAVRDNFGENTVPIPVGATYVVKNFGDLNVDGIGTVGVLQSHPTALVSLYEMTGGAAVLSVQLPQGFRYLDMEPVLGSDGKATAFVVLGVSEWSGNVRVLVYDVVDGSLDHSYFLGRAIVARDLEVVTASDGSVRAIVLAEQAGGQRCRLLSVDVATGIVSSRVLQKGVDATSIDVLPVSASGQTQIALIGTFPTTGFSRVFVHDSNTLFQTGSFTIGNNHVVDLEVLSNANGSGNVFAVLSVNALGQSVLGLYGNNGVAISSTIVSPIKSAVGLEGVGSVNGEKSVAVLLSNPIDGFNEVVRYSLTGIKLSQVGAGAGFHGKDFAVASVDGRAAVGIVQVNENIGVQQLKTRPVIENGRFANIGLTGTSTSPDWYLDSVAHGHTRYYPYHPNQNFDYYNWAGYLEVGQNFAELGATSFVRAGRFFDENPLWPSAFPLDPNGNQYFLGPRDEHGILLSAMENPVQATISEGWQHDLPMIAYYNEMSDALLASLHPEWIMRDYNGNPITHPSKGTFLDITGPFGEIMLGRMLELADMGAAGIYLDFRHTPAGGAWHSQMAADYEAATGLPAPPPTRNADYQQFQEFCQQRLVETMEHWKQVLT